MRGYIVPVLTLSLFVCGATVLTAATKKPAKPLPKRTPSKLATVQLPGDNGEFGKVFKMRKEYPLFFSLKSAEFTTNQLSIGDNLYAPKAGEKLLVLHFTIQNPQKAEQYVRWDSLKFTAVDAMNVNHEDIRDWGDRISHAGVGISLKPAQTIEVYTGIRVPAKGIVPKLMVLPEDENDGGVLRYDLKLGKNKVAPLAAPYADQSDPSGYTALETVPGTLNTPYPCAEYDIAVQKVEYSAETLESDPLEDDARYLVVTMQVKCESSQNALLRWDSFEPVVTSTDGEELQYKDMYLATANRSVGKNMKPGDEMTVRLLFVVPKDVTPKTLSIKEEESRVYEFKL